MMILFRRRLGEVFCSSASTSREDEEDMALTTKEKTKNKKGPKKGGGK